MSTADRPTPPSASPSIALDAKGLRALAHPVRVQLLGALRRFGASTATALGQRLGVSSGTASYHLRQLAGAGFVVEDSERGNNRERWWRAAHIETLFDSSAYVEREPEATFLYHQAVAAAHARRMQDAVNEYATLPAEWREVSDMSDYSLWLSPEEALRLGQEVREVIARYRQAGAEKAPEGTGRVSMIVHVIPEADERPPTASGEE
ncbi:winged helix-turn-helix domain-containing protein [Streptomyces sp. SID11385]|uniref:winged helix-turn-helix domain-containing protein n=1 Tax=Streptomyces sp. SID11385 TaxID=2706031 RepID=UPI0013CC9BCA|nr:winged helix-turn-helix domain-containing protein [Streptomyces sp. SID11385]NEA41975.1 winged helix-turn-helix transcriptional regulator [Streptomyces sp. SID11385]